MEHECSRTPGAIPTTMTPTGSIPDRITRYLSTGFPESSKRLIAYRCAMVLLIIDCALTAVICYQGMNFRPVDNGLLTAFGALNLIIAGLAQQIYRKPDAQTKPGTPNEGANG